MCYLPADSQHQYHCPILFHCRLVFLMSLPSHICRKCKKPNNICICAVATMHTTKIFVIKVFVSTGLEADKIFSATVRIYKCKASPIILTDLHWNVNIRIFKPSDELHVLPIRSSVSNYARKQPVFSGQYDCGQPSPISGFVPSIRNDKFVRSHSSASFCWRSLRHVRQSYGETFVTWPTKQSRNWGWQW
jgi:hypothetical protein